MILRLDRLWTPNSYHILGFQGTPNIHYAFLNVYLSIEIVQP
jgi:hypothetical protein